MLRPMFGMGMSEILVILLVAALFLGPEKLPDAATKISKGIRDLRRQTRDLQDTIENDTEIGGAIRDLKSALRGDDLRRPPVRKPAKVALAAAAIAVEGTEAAALPPAVADPAPGGSDSELARDDVASAALTASERLAAADHAASESESALPALTLAPTAGESELDEPPDPDEAAELARLVRPVSGAVKRDGHGPS